MRVALGLVGLLWGLGACGVPAGTECEIVGSGFHAKDPCRYKCLSRWSVNCPDGQPVTPGECSGAFGCELGSCPEGQVCYHDDDPFDDRSFCVMATTCGALGPEELGAWELASLARQQEVRADRAAKAARRAAALAKQGRTEPAPTAQAEPIPPPPPAPPSQPAPTLPPPTQPPPSQPAKTQPPPIQPPLPPPPLPCDPTPERAAVSIPAAGSTAGPVVLSEDEAFEQRLDNGWRFVMQPVEHGWHLGLLDRPETAGVVDLSAGTPPLRLPTNPRFVLGWHFRNRDNTGENTGEVNAPQHLRLFEFVPDASGSAPATGRGWLRIEDMELSPPAAGEKAGFRRLAFRACLTWPRSDPPRSRRSGAVSFLR